MKVLILSMTVGQGHNSASHALAQYLEKRGHTYEILDTYKFLNKVIGEAFDKGYTFMGRSIPKLNEYIYKEAERISGKAAMKSYFPFAFSDLFKSKMQKYLDEHKPDVIVCSIVFSAILLTQLKEAGTLDPKIKLYGIVTDYALHPFWEYTALDYFVVANELMVPSVELRGIREEKILPIGIPVRECFSSCVLKETARDKLGLDPDLLTLLITSGGRGFGAVGELLAQADKMDGVQIVAVCGTNTLLRRKLESKKYKNVVRICGFVNNIDEYIDAADVIVAKPGGLSTSETIAKKKLLVLTPPLPGVEDINLVFLINNSMALATNKHLPLNEVLMQLVRNEEKMAEILKSCCKWGKPNSSQELGDFIEQKFKEDHKIGQIAE
jgi:processive 1,2-diacylglycerol beta-glucosyltransferase